MIDLGGVDLRIDNLRLQLLNAQTNMDDLASSGSTYVLAYRLLQNARLNPDKLSGRTRAEALPAFEAMEAIWGQVSLIQAELDNIKALRASLPVIGRERRLEEIWARLTGPCIKLPPVSVPLDKRTLLSPSEVADLVSIESLLRAAVDAFERGRSQIIAIHNAIERITSVRDRQAQTLGELAEAANRYGIATSELDTVRHRLDTLSRQIFSDPLGAQDQVKDTIEPLLDDLRVRIEATRASTESLRVKLADAKRRLADCQRRQSEVTKAIEYCRGHIAGAPEVRRYPAKLERMTAQLPVIERNLINGLALAAVKGLESWSVLADEFQASETAALQAFGSLREEHLSLRGILETLKSRSVRLHLSEDPDLMALVATADSTMYAPALTDLAAARQLVESYRDRLHALETEG